MHVSMTRLEYLVEKMNKSIDKKERKEYLCFVLEVNEYISDQLRIMMEDISEYSEYMVGERDSHKVQDMMRIKMALNLKQFLPYLAYSREFN